MIVARFQRTILAGMLVCGTAVAAESPLTSSEILEMQFKARDLVTAGYGTQDYEGFIAGVEMLRSYISPQIEDLYHRVLVARGEDGQAVRVKKINERTGQIEEYTVLKMRGITRTDTYENRTGMSPSDPRRGKLETVTSTELDNHQANETRFDIVKHQRQNGDVLNYKVYLDLVNRWNSDREETKALMDEVNFYSQLVWSMVEVTHYRSAGDEATVAAMVDRIFKAGSETPGLALKERQALWDASLSIQKMKSARTHRELLATQLFGQLTEARRELMKSYSYLMRTGELLVEGSNKLARYLSGLTPEQLKKYQDAIKTVREVATEYQMANKTRDMRKEMSMNGMAFIERVEGVIGKDRMTQPLIELLLKIQKTCNDMIRTTPEKGTVGSKSASSTPAVAKAKTVAKGTIGRR